MTYIAEHGAQAPWVVLAAMLLAGMSVPVSIDVLLAVTACLAATTLREHTLSLFLALLIGAYLSAMIAYSMGRFLGAHLYKWKWFRTLFTEARVTKLRSFYQKYGLLTLIIGRFIPFGMRNCLFVTTGISRYSFLSFIARDALACTLWTTSCFWLFYLLGENYRVLYTYLKVIGGSLLAMGALTCIGYWFFRKRRTAS